MRYFGQPRVFGMPLGVGSRERALAQKILAENPLGLWKLNESAGTSGNSSVKDSSGNGYHGTPSGVTFADRAFPKTGELVASFPGTAAYINVLAAGLATALTAGNYGNEGTFLAYPSVDSWAGGANRYVFAYNVDATNFIRAWTSTTAGEFSFVHAGAGTTKTITVTGQTVTAFRSIILRVTGGEVSAFINGIQVGTTQTGAGTFTGDIVQAALGALTATGVQPHDGGLGYCAILPALTDAQIAVIG